jgi:hypothetical protein
VPPLKEAPSDATVFFKVGAAESDGPFCTISGPVAGFDLCEASWVVEPLSLSGNGNVIQLALRY